MHPQPAAAPLADDRSVHCSSSARLLKGLTWRRVACTLLAVMGLAVWTGPGSWLLDKSRWHPKLEIIVARDFLVDHGLGLVFVFIVYLPVFFSQMLALTVADNLRVPRVPRGVVLVIALLLGTTLGSAVVVLLTNDFFGVVAGRGLAWGGLIALVYFKRRRDAELAAALHDAQLARMDQQKKALESELQLMQAQVEPQFLFNTLRRIGDLYETQPASADRMLESLIAYLRAALPQMRANTSTLGRELQLVRAYLDIERIGKHGRLDFTFDIPDRLVSATFPPMVVLPLIQAIAMRNRDSADASVALRAEARADAGGLEFTLAHTGDGGSALAELNGISRRLAALYGAGGRLEVEPLEPRGIIALLHVPYVPG